MFLYDIGSYGCGEGQLNSPAGLAVDAYNQLIVCDSGNGRVQVFSLTGKFLHTMQGSVPRTACALQKPWFVAVSSDNEILISDVSGPWGIFYFR